MVFDVHVNYRMVCVVRGSIDPGSVVRKCCRLLGVRDCRMLCANYICVKKKTEPKANSWTAHR